jgi:hypothetical protein
MEQTVVESHLDVFSALDPDGHKTMIGEINSLLNPSGAVEDFSEQGDREAIGNKVIEHIRKTGGCNVTGTRIKQC